ncbi:MAG: ABC transporter substrate-binding protein [Ilumatobacter sp.]
MFSSSISRRDLFGLAAGALVVGGCGSARVGRAAPSAGFGDAQLSAAMRSSFVDELAATVERQTEAWSTDVNAEVDLDFSGDNAARVATIARQRQGADVGELSGNAPHEYADRLVDVSEIAERIGEASGGWIDVARRLCVVDGVWRAVPWASSNVLLNVRPSVLEAAGVEAPATYEDMLEVATRLREERLPLIGCRIAPEAPLDSAALAYSMLWAYGGREVDESGGRVALDSDATRAALAAWEEIAALGEPRAFNYDEGGNNPAFLNGDIAITQNGTSILWRARHDGLAIADDIELVGTPGGPAGRHLLTNIHSLGVFEHSRNVEAALSWVEALLGAERIAERSDASLGHYLPPLNASIVDPAMPWNRDALLAGLRDDSSLRHHQGWPGPPSREAELVYRNRTLVKMFDAVGTGRFSVDRAAKIAAAEMARVYET